MLEIQEKIKKIGIEIPQQATLNDLIEFIEFEKLKTQQNIKHLQYRLLDISILLDEIDNIDISDLLKSKKA